MNLWDLLLETKWDNEMHTDKRTSLKVIMVEINLFGEVLDNG